MKLTKHQPLDGDTVEFLKAINDPTYQSKLPDGTTAATVALMLEQARKVLQFTPCNRNE